MLFKQLQENKIFNDGKFVKGDNDIKPEEKMKLKESHKAELNKIIEKILASRLILK